MKNQPALDAHSIQSTMLLPLWGRAAASEKNPDILYDRQAIEIIKNFDYDFDGIAKVFGEFSGICYVVRARQIDDAIRAYMQTHPRATIVNIGAGLDTTFSRVDNGLIRWYNLDLPDAIAYRESFIPDSERNQSIAKSFFDTTWFEDVHFTPEEGIMFVSGGVFFYFREEELREVVAAMARRFPGGELYFDAESKQAVDKSNRMVQKTGNQGAPMYFYVNDAAALNSWAPEINLVSCLDYFAGIPRSRQWSWRSRLMARASAWMGLMKFIHLGFSHGR